ncbi:hypothetical protein GCM10010520_58650 [Rhizobium viscosum]|uniref:DUF3592 domain-containing protein n=1 Tax=Rhizobium viscosum TaxID=1673 RepID=A0ABR9IT88_RHIVS|nr:hypothetical protein [Rhizobium viscosum]MBE1506414.1 hypothetical protein [Rhizobium viscosum]
MSARRWFFYLWLLIALVWVAIIGVIGWPAIVEDYGWAENKQLEHDRPTELPVRCEQARGVIHFNYEIREAAEPWNRDEYETPSQACWYDERHFRILWPEYKDMPLADLLTQQYQSLEWSQQFHGDPYFFTKLAVVVAVIPPLALFAVGRLFAWMFVHARRLVRLSRNLP